MFFILMTRRLTDAFSLRDEFLKTLGRKHKQQDTDWYSSSSVVVDNSLSWLLSVHPIKKIQLKLIRAEWHQPTVDRHLLHQLSISWSQKIDFWLKIDVLKTQPQKKIKKKRRSSLTSFLCCASFSRRETSRQRRWRGQVQQTECALFWLAQPSGWGRWLCVYVTFDPGSL